MENNDFKILMKTAHREKAEKIASQYNCYITDDNGIYYVSGSQISFDLFQEHKNELLIKESNNLVVINEKSVSKIWEKPKYNLRIIKLISINTKRKKYLYNCKNNRYGNKCDLWEMLNPMGMNDRPFGLDRERPSINSNK